MNTRNRFLALASVLLVSSLAATTHAGGFNTNLVVNGDCANNNVIGWTTNGMEPVSTGSTGTQGLPPGEVIGSFAFQGGVGPNIQTATQSISLTHLAGAISSGLVTCQFRILVQSRADSAGNTDTVTGTLTYFDIGNVPLGTVGIADPNIQPNGVDWAVVADTRPVPTGTRRLELSFTFTRAVGASTDAYFDNASVILTSSCPADLNGDAAVDGADLGILLGAWGSAGPGDLNGDGSVDGADLGALLAAWGPC